MRTDRKVSGSKDVVTGVYVRLLPPEMLRVLLRLPIYGHSPAFSPVNLCLALEEYVNHLNI